MFLNHKSMLYFIVVVATVLHNHFKVLHEWRKECNISPLAISGVTRERAKVALAPLTQSLKNLSQKTQVS